MRSGGTGDAAKDDVHRDRSPGDEQRSFELRTPRRAAALCHRQDHGSDNDGSNRIANPPLPPELRDALPQLHP